MSALGQKQTCAAQKVMSALLPIADINASTYGDHSTSDHISPLIVRW